MDKTTIKRGLRDMMATVSPELAERLVKSWRTQQNKALTSSTSPREQNPYHPDFEALRPLENKAGTEMNWAVQTGPFAGMKYIQDATGSALAPKVLGSYEEELHAIVEESATRGYTTVVDIGCAEGYYAVGYSRLLPNATVYAFDIDFLAQRLCRKLAQLNHVEKQLVIGGECDFSALRRLAGPSTLIVCDCEGCEQFILDVNEVPQLKKTDILLELHECFEVGLTRAIIDRFEPSHEIHIVDAVDRNPDAYPQIAQFAPNERALLVDEHRFPGMQYAWMTAKNK